MCVFVHARMCMCVYACVWGGMHRPMCVGGVGGIHTPECMCINVPVCACVCEYTQGVLIMNRYTNMY